VPRELRVVIVLALAAILAAGAARVGGAATPPKPTGKALFVATCGSCHTLRAAGTKGRIGPNLTGESNSYAEVVAKVQRGDGAMPSFRRTLTKAQIAKIAAFLVASAPHSSDD
jgi:mono/diheme cytochrome c family protein